MKTTQSQFTIFQEEFKRWQMLFGCQDFEITFSLAPHRDAMAAITISTEGRAAHVTLASGCTDPTDIKRFDPRAHALHEALHLLITKITVLAHDRYVTRVQLDDAEEGMVRVLEKVLFDNYYTL